MKQLLARAAQLTGRDHNPLRRYVDKVECAVLMSLILAFLVGAPFVAIAAGRAADSSAQRARIAAQGDREVQAVLLQSAAAGQVDLDGTVDASYVNARWVAPDGVSRTGILAVPLNARAGDRAEVWVTRAGVLTGAPPGRGEQLEATAVAAATSVAGLAALLLVLGVIIRITANRRRLARWSRAWKTVGPDWSRQR
jgi:hypothetical protein